MWRDVGIVRRPADVSAASKLLADISLRSNHAFALSLAACCSEVPAALSDSGADMHGRLAELEAACGLRNIAVVAASIAIAAAANGTSVGTHYLDPDFQ